MDLAPLAKCPHGRKGAHRADSFVTMQEDGTHRFVWACRACGATRLVGNEAFAPSGSLDDLSVDAIERAMFGGRP